MLSFLFWLTGMVSFSCKFCKFMLQNVVYRFKCIIGRLLALLIDADIFVLACRDPHYWNERFSKEEHYEWFKDYSHFRHLIQAHVPPSSSVCTLSLACFLLLGSFIYFYFQESFVSRTHFTVLVLATR
jgi:hypothetical protein